MEVGDDGELELGDAGELEVAELELSPQQKKEEEQVRIRRAILMRHVRLDHNYSYPDDIDALRRQCDNLRKILEKKTVQDHNLRRRLARAFATKKYLKEVVSTNNEKNEKPLS